MNQAEYFWLQTKFIRKKGLQYIPSLTLLNWFLDVNMLYQDNSVDTGSY